MLPLFLNLYFGEMQLLGYTATSSASQMAIGCTAKAASFCRSGKLLVLRGLWFAAFSLIIFFQSQAQATNQWINFNQQYFKVPISKDGIYRISYADLQAANFPVNSVDPRLIQLFHRGVEQAIFVQGEADAVFNTNDYIEFFGKRNDGTLDKKLYQPASAQLNPYYNLYSDTTAYFLTYRLSLPAAKRMDFFYEGNTANIPQPTHHNEERWLLATTYYSNGFKQNDELENTFFDQGEGWVGQPIRQNESVDYVINGINNSVPGAGLPQLEMLVVGLDNFQHSGQVLVGSGLRNIATLDFTGYNKQLISVHLQWSDIANDGTLAVRLSAGAATNNRLQMAVCYIKVIFPQYFNMAGSTEKFFYISASITNQLNIEIENPATGLRVWDVTDANNVSIIGTYAKSGAIGAVVNNTLTSRKIFAAGQVNSVSIKPISFRNLSGRSPSFIIVTNKVLMQPAGGYANPVQAYAAYRASVQGGGYDTLVLTMDQVYNQFNYGETSALALHECMNYWIDTADPKFLFLIGKGRDINGFSAYQRKTPPVGDIKDLVPSAGLPASDIAYTAGLSAASSYPKIATGRLPATQAVQVANYLNKVKETESTPVATPWKKNGLHLSGGIQPTELPLFRSYVDGFKQIAIKDFWGASITTIGKRDPNPVQLINVADQVNKGVNLITFFGHSSPGTIDIDIGFASDPILGYNNAGKYPVFLINGCNVGSFFLNGTLFGEDWVLAPNKGARNFIAHSSFGFANTLKAYSDLFYRVGFADSVFIQRGVGEVQQEVAKRYLNLYGNSISSITQVQQMILLGDPALKLFGTSKPDFAVENNSVTLQSLDGTPVTALSQVFALKIIVKNTGATTSKKLPVRVLRTFSDNSTVAYDSVFASPLNQDTVLFRIRRDSRGGGQNTFTVTLDQGTTIAETSKLNNATVLSVLIPSNATKNLFPTPYSIVATTSVNFLFQSTNLLGNKRDFRFELDTAASFNSPLLKQQTISAKVLAKTLLNLSLRDSTTYYWRTRLDKPSAIESAEWNTTSFTYIKNGSEGWGQFQFPQLVDNPVAGILKDAQNRKLKYLETVLPVAITTYGSGYAAGPTSPSVKINNIEYNLATQGQPCRTNTINILAFDKTTGVPYAGIPFNFQDPRTCGREPQVINSFTLAEIETGLGDDLIAAISNIKQSDSVVLFSIGDASYSAWSTDLKSKLTELGISFSQVSSLQEGEPLVIFGKKNATAGTAKILRASNMPANQQLLQVNSQISARFSSGTIKSPLIGPANKWFNFFNKITQLQTSDQFYYKIYGVDLRGNESLLMDNIVATTSLSSIDAVQFPYLRLELHLQDVVNLTPAQLKNWLVAYESVAEGILVYRGTTTPVSVQEGQSVDLPFAFVNLSGKNFKSALTVESEVIPQSTGTSKKSTTTINPPTPNDSTKFVVTLETRGKVGWNDVSVFVNPRILPELYFENNALLLSNFLQVIPDKTPPVLTVQIDGRVILNNDYVSPNPRIEISVKDENHFMLKTDTVGVTLFLKQDCPTCNYQPIYFSRPDVNWQPATQQSNFVVNFNPQNLVPGDYVLRAQAQDATGNKAGVKPYEIAFRVRDTNLLTLRSVYPNPSRAKFYFNFLLIGNELPSTFSLQIYTLSGKCIQNFTANEMDLFHIGTNELTWEATDEEGNALPSGIYIYKFSVSTSTNSAVQQGKLVVTK
jgi:hypothetical protein